MKFQRPTSYTGKQGTQSWTGDVRFANAQEVTAANNSQIAISPVTLASALAAIGTGFVVVDPAVSVNPMSANKIYVVQAGTQTFTLPATFAVGKVFSVMLAAGTQWIIQANAGQTMRFSGSVSTSGGTVFSSAVGDSIFLLATSANTVLTAYSVMGSPGRS